MQFNVFGEKVSRARHKKMVLAAKNRRELIAAQLSRRELIKMGLVTPAGLLVPICVGFRFARTTRRNFQPLQIQNVQHVHLLGAGGGV